MRGKGQKKGLFQKKGLQKGSDGRWCPARAHTSEPKLSQGTLTPVSQQGARCRPRSNPGTLPCARGGEGVLVLKAL